MEAASSPSPIAPPRVLDYLSSLGFETTKVSEDVSKTGNPVYYHTAWPRSEGRFEDAYPHASQSEDAFNPLWISAARRVASTAVWMSRVRYSADSLPSASASAQENPNPAPKDTALPVAPDLTDANQTQTSPNSSPTTVVAA